MIKLKSKTQRLELTITISADGVTKEVFTNPRYQLSNRLQAVLVGLRSELTMFLLEIEKELRD